MAMASQALQLTRHRAPSALLGSHVSLPAASTTSTQRLLTPSFPRFHGWSTSSSARGAQRRVFQVSAAAAEPGSVPPPTPKANITPPAPPKPTLKKGQIVRVDKEKYLNSVEYLSVGHPKYFTGLDYIYEDRGEVLNTRFFDHGEYALIAWAGIPTSPAWLPTYMLIKADRLSYKRQ